MNENEWWRRYAKKMVTFPETSFDEEALIDLLQTAGFYGERTGLPRPDALCPERAATAAYRLRYVAPREVGEGCEWPVPPVVPLREPWWIDDEPEYWQRVEDGFVELEGGYIGWRSSLRSPGGEFTLRHLREERSEFAKDPVALAIALHER